MKRHIPFVIAFVFLLFLWTPQLVKADGPPPPAFHSRNDNTAARGATGCPIDRTHGIILSLGLCLGYAGFTLFRRGVEPSSTEAKNG